MSTSADLSDHGSFLFYGPVVEDGYGCAYNIQANEIIMAVSSFASNTRTDGKAFHDALSSALCEMRALITAVSGDSKVEINGNLSSAMSATEAKTNLPTKGITFGDIFFSKKV